MNKLRQECVSERVNY